MKEKRNVLYKTIMSIVVAMMLMFSVAIPAFADDPYAKGTESEPADAAITKRLVMPEETITPSIMFEFVIAKKGLDGKSDPADLDAMPGIPNKEVSFTSADAGDIADEIKTINKETGHLFEGISFDRAGVYEYTVTELTTTFTNSFEEKVTFTSAVYDIVVYVDNKADGSGVYILAIGAYIVVNDESNEDEPVGSKVDPTPGDMTIEVGDYSEMIFTNYYLKNNGGTEPDDTVLALSKVVTGMAANQEKYFPFSVTASNPVTVVDNPSDPATTYKAYVYDGTSLVDDLSDYLNTAAANIGTDDEGRDYIIFENGSPVTVNLKHGQWLSFIDLPVGAGYVITESAVADYTASYILSLDGVTSTEKSNLDSNEELSTGARKIADVTAAASAAFSNAYKTITPGGISVDNLPYYVIAGLALLALFGFVAFKSRKRASNIA